MVVEVLHPSQEWPLSLPKEDFYYRRALEARDREGASIAQWVRGEFDIQWVCIRGANNSAYCDRLGCSTTFANIIADCIRNNWVLVSLPPDEG